MEKIVETKKTEEPDGLKPIDGYEGLVLMPIIFLKYRGRVAKGAYSGADSEIPYPLLNELVSPWQITFKTDKETLILSWRSDFGIQAFDDGNGYPVLQQIGYKQYNRLAAAQKKKKLTVTITFKVQYYKFFYKFLEGLRDNNDDDPDDLSTLAGPASSLKSLSAKHREILDTFTKHKGKYVFKQEGYAQENLSCDFEAGSYVATATDSRFIKLDIYIRAREALPTGKDVDEFVTAMVAADWTALYGIRALKSPPPSLRNSMGTWGKNIQIYMANYTRLERGKRILEKIVSVGKAEADKGAGVQKIIQTVRDEIDRRLITANVWHAPRENKTSESYQYELMWLLSSLALPGKEYFKETLPIYRYRALASELDYTLEQRAHFILQAGVGHCSEHAQVAFLALKAIEASTVGAIPTPIISSGQTRTDHALVIVGVLPRWVLRAKYKKTNPHYDEAHPDRPIHIWDLRQALNEAGGGGYVCDPYLQRVYKNARAFLEGKTEKTDFVLYRDIAPDGVQVIVDESKEVVEI